MGNNSCTNVAMKNRQVSKAVAPQQKIRSQPVISQPPSTGIRKVNNELQLSHAPLFANKKLKQMFDANSKEPDELVMDMMLLTNTLRLEGRVLEFKILAKSPVRIWILENCRETIHPPSNLTIKFTEASLIRCAELVPERTQVQYTEKIRTELTLEQAPGKTPLVLILQQLNTIESMFMLYYFNREGPQLRLAKQKYDWCGLSFSVDQIYGSNHGHMNALQKQLCSICLTNDVNTIVVPCRHMCLCDQCGKTLIQKNSQVCPICRKPYNTLIAYTRQK